MVSQSAYFPFTLHNPCQENVILHLDLQTIYNFVTLSRIIIIISFRFDKSSYAFAHSIKPQQRTALRLETRFLRIPFTFIVNVLN